MDVWFIMEVGEVGVGVQTEVMGDQKCGPHSAANSSCLLQGANAVSSACLQSGGGGLLLRRTQRINPSVHLLLDPRSFLITTCKTGDLPDGLGELWWWPVVTHQFRMAPVGLVVPLCAFTAKSGFGVPARTAEPTAVLSLSEQADVLTVNDPTQWQFPLPHSAGVINVLIALDDWITWANRQIFPGNHCNERILAAALKFNASRMKRWQRK